jgi:hypothetical protein
MHTSCVLPTPFFLSKMASLEQYKPYFSIVHLLRMVILLVDHFNLLMLFFFHLKIFYTVTETHCFCFLLASNLCLLLLYRYFFGHFVHYVMGKEHILIPIALMPNLIFCGGYG